MRLIVFVPLVLFLILFGEEYAFASPPNYELHLTFKIPHSKLLTNHHQSVLTNYMRTAEKCINKALDEKASVSLKQKELIYYEENLPGLKLSTSVFMPDFMNGDVIPIESGQTTNEYIVSFRETIDSVPWAITSEIWNHFKQPRFNVLFTYEREYLAYKLSEFEISQLAEKVDKLLSEFKDLTSGNVIRMKKKYVLIRTNDKDRLEAHGLTLAHELMHAFGGLDDLYRKEYSTRKNLMGAYGGHLDCVLSPQQINFIIYYRGQN